MFYLPRTTVNQDNILTEDPLSKFTQAYPLEMYLSDIDGFQGEGDLLTKFGVELRDTANFIVSRRRWEQSVQREGSVQLAARPAEGYLLYSIQLNPYRPCYSRQNMITYQSADSEREMVMGSTDSAPEKPMALC